MNRHSSQEACPWHQRFAGESSEPGYAARRPGERPTGVEPEGGVEAAVTAETAEPGRPGSPRAQDAAAGGATPWPDRPPHPGTEAPSLVDLMRMTREDWDAFSRGSAIRRAGYAGFKRNVAVAMGNWLAGMEGDPPEEAVAVLRKALADESELVREHAAWAWKQAPPEGGAVAPPTR